MVRRGQWDVERRGQSDVREGTVGCEGGNSVDMEGVGREEGWGGGRVGNGVLWTCLS